MCSPAWRARPSSRWSCWRLLHRNGWRGTRGPPPVDTLPARPRAAHKGDFGRVLLIAGGPGMAGAARLAGEACLRCGAGLVTVLTAPENVTAIVANRPELICLGAADTRTLEAPLAAATVVAIGPGLGTG